MKDISIPLKMINLLADGEFYSGKKISRTLGISFAAINTYIQIIRNWGIHVFTVPGKGYCLHAQLQLLNETAIRARLPSGRLTVLSVVDSTNQYLIERMLTLKPGDACVAEYQKHGRGRRGRQWISPFGNNLYFSLYWRLEQGLSSACVLSLMVGIVIAEMLRHLGAEGVRIKWPNDLYLNNCKMAGILMDIIGNTGRNANVVIGVGINLTMSASEAKLIDQDWINLQEAGIAIDRNVLVAELIDNLRRALLQFERDGFSPFVARWQALDVFCDQPVKLLIGEREIRGIARGIDVRGALLLEQDGECHAYLGGEISLRGLSL
ncbi:bifunctional biotin--[acetyl-CoA-carboxylase] ligase/biotin operon repressor BirA [Sodalis endosymbiont of Henestaris halophilus]|uniref:bifunctional biotin--[acetyl-CoA-carboxylase] ligase/biotin operon repressor BirA n=1 Tax=Sodalis endosymbiont of Henestaris halophilus TaxID=1929246 RepID=UPI000BBF41CA|nr:bifunctional biotin--[acetyl-CoA-carboxylase] ligase/biotin operon repressor BirA [Sodalis endosymbiont of Henestaris halophilus]SNC58764.1 Bifunctional ligase/repressor BirA [Sodalis endosymbiont of Henestaris halophilus]